MNSFIVGPRPNASPFFSIALALLPSLLSVGCGLSLNSEPDINSNTCSSSSDCGSEGACVSTQDGEARCVATSADLGNVILEVRPTGSQASIVFDNVVNVVDQSDKGMLQDLDLVMPAAVVVTGHVPAPDGLEPSCLGGDGHLPVDVTLIRQVDFSPFASRYEIPSPTALDASAEAAFSFAVPPGTYDLYLQPRLLAGCEATLPAPELRTTLKIQAGEPYEVSPDGMAETIQLTGLLTVPINIDAAELSGWVLEVLDPTYGYVISNQYALAEPAQGVSTLEIEGFFYHKTTNPLLRLRDLDGNLSVHWALTALDLNSDNAVELDLRDLVAKTHSYGAYIIDSSGAAVQSAGVVLQSTELTGSANQNANYHVDTRTDVNGDITVSLVPGTYAVTIIPDVPGDATYFGEWIVKEPEPDEEDIVDGKGFRLLVQPVLSGSVSDPLAGSLASAPIAVGPSQAMTSTYFTRALVDPEPVKRQFSTSTGLDGSFTLSVDPGEIDIAVQMAAETGYPWSVLPSFKVDEAALKPQVDIGEIQLRYPVMLQGHVSDAGTAIPYAEVRAWVRGASESGDGPLIQIGSAITDADGGYVLPLPPGITFDETAPAETAEDAQ